MSSQLWRHNQLKNRQLLKLSFTEKWMWQDITITVVNLIFVYSLIPQVYQGFKDKRPHIHFQTGLLTFSGMYAMAFAFFSLGLTFSGIIGAINATLWLILFVQGLVYKK